jgi:hypothetical protein
MRTRLLVGRVWSLKATGDGIDTAKGRRTLALNLTRQSWPTAYASEMRSLDSLRKTVNGLKTVCDLPSITYRKEVKIMKIIIHYMWISGSGKNTNNKKKGETESATVALRKRQSLQLFSYFKREFFKRETDGKCRLCKKCEETIGQLTWRCPILANKTRTGIYLYYSNCKKLFIGTTANWHSLTHSHTHTHLVNVWTWRYSSTKK